MEYIVNKIYNSITYILPVGNSRDCWLVDCGDVEKVIERGWHVRGVLLTHAHFDHIYGLNILVAAFPDILVYTNHIGKEGTQNPKWNISRYHKEVEDFVFCRPENIRVFDGEGQYHIDEGLTVEVLFTPGHEPSCITYRLGNLLLTGDSYIPGVKVATNLPRSNKQQAADSLSRLQELESSGLTIMPGHWVKN